MPYYGYRYYSPKLDRWINRDPIREEAFLWQLMSLSVFGWDKFTWLNSSSYHGSDYSFMYNFVVGTYDVLGLLPPGGYPEWDVPAPDDPVWSID